jgi:5-methylcytosine-specific restriction endonuclease McrA
MKEPEKSLQKSHRERLEGKEYQRLVKRVFERDRWTCRNPFCQRRRNLTPHHLKKRSQLGGDEMENLITLCVPCHDAVERNELKIEVVDVVVKFHRKD